MGVVFRDTIEGRIDRLGLIAIAVCIEIIGSIAILDRIGRTVSEVAVTMNHGVGLRAQSIGFDRLDLSE